MAKAVTAMIGIEESWMSSLSQRLEARYFGELNVHQDQIGAMRPRKLDGFDAVRRFQGDIAMRFEEVVEELHVELIVLDDQNCFGHSEMPSPEGPYALPTPSSSRQKPLLTSPHCRSSK
jgi:hypothetical protein